MSHKGWVVVKKLLKVVFAVFIGYTLMFVTVFACNWSADLLFKVPIPRILPLIGMLLLLSIPAYYLGNLLMGSRLNPFGKKH